MGKSSSEFRSSGVLSFLRLIIRLIIRLTIGQIGSDNQMASDFQSDASNSKINIGKSSSEFRRCGVLTFLCLIIRLIIRQMRLIVR